MISSWAAEACDLRTLLLTSADPAPAEEINRSFVSADKRMQRERRKKRKANQ